MWRVEFCFSSFSRVGGLCHRRKVVQSLQAVADDYLVLICSNCVAATEARLSGRFGLSLESELSRCSTVVEIATQHFEVYSRVRRRYQR